MSMKYLRWASCYASTIVPTASEANSSKPAANLGVERLASCWRSNGGLSAVDIYIDLGSARQVDLIGLGNHNLTSAATIAVAAGTTTGYSNYSTTITWREGSAYAVISQLYRHWRIRLTDAANTFGYLEAGNLFIGPLSTPIKGVSLDPGISIQRIAQNLKVESGLGSPSIDRLVNRKRISLAWRNLEAAERVDLITFFDNLAEEANPLFLIPDSTLYEGYYCRLQDSPTDTRQFLANIPQVSFLEDGSGKRIGA